MSELFKKILISPQISSLMNVIVGHYVTIYMIHRPKPVDRAYDGLSPALLEECIVYAQNAGFEFASIDEVLTNALAHQKPKRPTLCFTLDDGYQDQWDQLVPVLLKHNCKPTLFTIIDMVDGIDWPWDSKISFAIWNTRKTHLRFDFENTGFDLELSQPQARRAARRKLTRFGKRLTTSALDNYMRALLEHLDIEPPTLAPPAYQPLTWEALREAEKAGLRIGSHACSHRVFSALPDEQILDELNRAQKRLSYELSNPSQVFCYPSGTAADFSRHHTELVKQTNYFIGAVTSIPGNIKQTDIQKDPYTVKRHSFPDSFEKFVRYSSWLEYIRSGI
jgi:peptidoglycan/xylan/chitin deacetylase (PgdA/CDA1 family)